jgi:hypothetical protein
MRGAWLTSIASRLLREQTFQLIAAPAIADLQHEGGRRHYAAVWWVIARALLRDLYVDVAAAFGSTARASVWPKAVGLFALLFVMMTVLALRNGIRLLAPDGTVSTLPWPPLGDGLEPLLVGLLVSVALAAAGYATMGFTFELRRRHTSARTILVATLCLAALAHAAARISRPVAENAELYRSAAMARDGVGVPASRPLSEIVEEDIRQGRTALTAGSDERRTIAVWQERRIALNVLIFALLGVTLARGRGLGVLARSVGILGTAEVLRDAMSWLSVLFWPVNSPHPSATVEQLPAFLMLPLVTAVCLALDVVISRRRHSSCAS